MVRMIIGHDMQCFLPAPAAQSAAPYRHIAVHRVLSGTARTDFFPFIFGLKLVAGRFRRGAGREHRHKDSPNVWDGIGAAAASAVSSSTSPAEGSVDDGEYDGRERS